MTLHARRGGRSEAAWWRDAGTRRALGGRWRLITLTVLFALAHLHLAILVAVLAKGWDLDQPSSRSAVSGVAAKVDTLLWIPHALFISVAPAGRVSEYLWLVTAGIVANSSLYGLLFASIWRMWTTRRSAQRRGTVVD